MKTIVFDIGNVLFYFDHNKICSLLSKYSKYSKEEIFNIIFKQGLSKEFECGKLNENEFWNLLKVKCSLNCSKNNITSKWADIFSENKKLTSLLPEIRKNFKKLIICSNTNILHFEYLLNNWPEVFKYFDHFSLSYIIKHMKPDKEIFLDVKKHSIGNIIYFDDIPEYIKKAKKFGINGVIYNKNTNIKKILSIY